VQEVDWELEAHELSDWDEGALPTLTRFLRQHLPRASELRTDRDLSEERILQALTRCGRPVWTEHDFQLLLQRLQHAGYGWLRPSGIRAKLAQLARTLPLA
jgi:hypothetical protein